MSTRRTKYNKTSVENLPADKPVVYTIETEGGRPNYVGTAKMGRVRERIMEHFEDIPGATVQIEQFRRIDEARKKEARVIKRSKPKYNKLGK